MASKRLPLDDPPSASSSDEEEVSGGEYDDDEEENHQKKDLQLSGEDEGDEEEEDSPETKNLFVRKHTPITIVKPQSSLESGNGEEGSDIDSPSASGFTIEPTVSKLMDERMKAAKFSLKTLNSATLSKPASKRPAETETDQAEKKSRAKRSKVSAIDEDGAAAAAEQKSAANKLWSVEDEIAILKGMIDYKSEKGENPLADMDKFHDFVKKSLQVEASNSQLMSKIKRLKKKYRDNVEKGENLVFSKPRDRESFELSKNCWGSEESSKVKSNGKIRKRKAIDTGKVNNSVAAPQEDKAKELAVEEAKELAVEEAQEVLKGGIETHSCDFWSSYPVLDKQMQMQKGLFLSMSSSIENSVRETMSLLGNTKAKELELKWNDLQIDEIELYLRRVELIREQTKLVLSAMKLSKSCG